MKFSIIIPAYNSEKTIARAIKSIKSQNCNDYEIIVVDDNSKDNTIEEVQKFENVRLLKNKEQLKAGGGRNVGIQNASGEYIIFLDADDYFYNEHVLTNINQAIDEKYDLIYLGFIINRDGTLSETNLPKSNQIDKIIRLKEWRYTNVWDICWNREFLKRHNIKFIEKKHIAEDTLFYLEALKVAEKIKVTDIISHIYVVDSKSSSSTTKIDFEKMADFHYMISKTFEFADQIDDGKYKQAILTIIDNETEYAEKLKMKLKERLKQSNNNL